MSRTNLFVLGAILLTISLTAHSAQAQTLYVDGGASLGGDGATWSTAFRHLQDALAAAPVGSEIRVAQGVYEPDQDEAGNVTAGDRNSTFQLLNGVTVRGGYAGLGAPDMDARDVGAYFTILDGDLADDDVGSWWDPSVDENSFHVVTGSGTNSTAVLDGVTVTRGYGLWGGGIYIEDGGPTLIQVTFAGNFGAMFSGASANVLLSGCTFSNNYTRDDSAGIYNQGTLVATDCAFNGNTANEDAGGLLNTGTVTLTGCSFIGNSGNEDNGFAGGLTNYGTADLTDCVFLQNWHVNAGGIANGGNLTLINTLVGGNYSIGWYGGGGGLSSSGGVVSIVNSTFYENRAHNQPGGGIFLTGATDLDLTNSILWGNDGGGATLESKQIDTSGGTGTVLVSSTCIEGLSGLAGSNNIGNNPLFVASGSWNDGGTPVDPYDDTWTAGDAHLTAASPAIDVGNDAAVTISTDLDGNPRIVDGDGDTTETVDMGAYEYQRPPQVPTTAAWGLALLALLLLGFLGLIRPGQ